MEHPIRIGAVTYLNTKPLICDLDILAPEAELVLEVPSRLADMLAREQLDVALIPVIDYFRSPGYTIVPNIAIASRGPVLSVTLFSRVPWTGIRRLALDAGSRTSVALTQILLTLRHGVKPELVSLPLDADPEHVDTDAVLLIGDRAMRACLPGFVHAYDLGEEWTEWTGMPFVYAVWAVRPGVDLGGVAPGAGGSEAAGVGAHRTDRPCRGAAAGAGRRVLPPLPSKYHPFRSGAARTGRAAPLLHAGLRTGTGPPGGEP